MASATVEGLRAKSDAAFARLTAQLEGMEAHLERSDAPGEWTARQVLSHLLFEPGWDPVATLEMFTRRDLPVIEIDPGQHYLDDQRQRMTLGQLVDALARQRRLVFGHLAGLSEADIAERKVRIPIFKQFMGTDEISIAAYVGAMFDYHWNDHAGQLAKIRKAVGLPEARER
jgi:hypothetical protein